MCPVRSINAASDLLQNQGVLTGRLPGLADRTNLPEVAETRQGAGDRGNAADQQEQVDNPATRPDERIDGCQDRTGIGHH